MNFPPEPQALHLHINLTDCEASVASLRLPYLQLPYQYPRLSLRRTNEEHSSTSRSNLTLPIFSLNVKEN
ncbi:hypothetical protein SAMN06265222_106241 [Neorhodopirellula lusitana]|uniref:Uncharacterized protein n=1 Tax=Neorhodopirellula lusitana TaxID=445327 RepID=A0ABY1Q4Q5_9BACT|nr:hypothetical protein SAMN06265222_106241 [Neorhodopirellula lusitana]